MGSDSFDTKLAVDSALATMNQGEAKRMEALTREGGVEQLEKVAAQFESVFLGILIKEMWESVDDSGLLPKGPGRQIYDGLFSTMLADHIARNGGVGLAKAMINQLKGAVEAYEKSGRQPVQEQEPVSGKGDEAPPLRMKDDEDATH